MRESRAQLPEPRQQDHERDDHQHQPDRERQPGAQPALTELLRNRELVGRNLGQTLAIDLWRARGVHRLEHRSKNARECPARGMARAR